MKRGIMILTAAVIFIVTIFSGCDPATDTEDTPNTPDTPYQKYMRAAESIQGADSVAARATADLHVIIPEDDAGYIRLNSEARWVAPYGPAPQMEILTKFYEAYDGDDDEGDNGDFSADFYQSYYRDGYLYTIGSGYGSYYQRNKVDTDFAFALLNLLRLEFDEADVVSGFAGQLSGGERINLTLSSRAMQDVMVRQLLYTVVSTDVYFEDAQEELAYTGASFGDLNCELILSPEYLPVSCTVSFDAELEFDVAESYQMHYTVTLDDIRLDTLSEIRFPKALDDKECYEDYSSGYDGYSGYGNSGDYGGYETGYGKYPLSNDRYYELQSHTNGYVFSGSYPVIVNTFGDDCNAALFLRTDYLDEIFWRIYQTRCGVTAPALPAGFTDPAQISAEGLARLFIFANMSTIDFYVDYDERRYYLPDAAVENTSKKLLSAFDYKPESLNGVNGFLYEHETLIFPFSLGEPEFNACRVDTAEVLGEERVKLTAIGIDRISENPVNTQEMVLFIDVDGNAVCESYTIKYL